MFLSIINMNLKWMSASTSLSSVARNILPERIGAFCHKNRPSPQALRRAVGVSCWFCSQHGLLAYDFSLIVFMLAFDLLCLLRVRLHQAACTREELEMVEALDQAGLDSSLVQQAGAVILTGPRGEPEGKLGVSGDSLWDCQPTACLGFQGPEVCVVPAPGRTGGGRRASGSHPARWRGFDGLASREQADQLRAVLPRRPAFWRTLLDGERLGGHWEHGGGKLLLPWGGSVRGRKLGKENI